MTRPPCPQGHYEDTWLDGRYGRNATYSDRASDAFRSSIRRRASGPHFTPTAEKPHVFTEPLPRRHAKPAAGSGPSQCVECEHVLDRHEGPQTTRRQSFTIREAADELVLVSHGVSMRKASLLARDAADRLVTDAWVTASRASRRGWLADGFPATTRSGGASARRSRSATAVRRSSRRSRRPARRKTLAWIHDNRPLMERQWAIRQDDRPHSIRGLETVLQEAVRRLGDRRFVFRNRKRLELIFDLMALGMAKLANPPRYREIIRRHLLADKGRPTHGRRALDHTRGSSLHQAVRDVEARLKKRREQNARAQRAHVSRPKAAGTTRVATPSARSRKRRG